MSDIFETRNASRPLEELVEIQALGVDLREAVMACLSGGESRCWTVGELVERFKNLGVCASRASVTAALAELEVELELCPWRLGGSWNVGRIDPGPQIRGSGAALWGEKIAGSRT